jgi:predicted extracellular nuclease
MKKINSLLVVLFIFISTCNAQEEDTIYVAFWNLQNLFDTIDDPGKNDESFLPDGDMEFTPEKLDKQMYNLSRVIRSMNNRKGPDLLGVCEVENHAVLKSMVTKYLSDLGYKTAYLESPDNRGIDNGLLYRADKFKLLNLQADTVHLSDDWPTRLIFGVNLLAKNDEKLTVFVNHWPSRRGGQEESEPNRIAAAQTLRNAVDRIFDKNINAKIMAIGDFNDEPLNISVLETLKAFPVKCDTLLAEFEEEEAGELYNLSYFAFESGLGTYKYKEDWNMIDQIIVSGSLLTSKEFFYLCNSFEVYKPYYIVTQSGQYKGAPFPTYGGRRYLGGYSDHYPIIAKFILNSRD